MEVDFLKCRIISPTDDELLRMYKDLWEIFPYDRPIYDEMIKTRKDLHTLKNYALFKDDEFLGNAALIPFKLYFQDVIIEIIGVGAVATMPAYRNKGIAKRLMRYCMQIVDGRGLPAALFTELEEVYRGHGFESVNQEYLACTIEYGQFDTNLFEFEIIDSINDSLLSELQDIYDNSAIIDGKVVRDDSYWQMYKMFFNPYPKPKIILCRKGQLLLGYARFDAEDDRITITEMWSKEGERIFESMLGRIWKIAAEQKINICTFAPAADHPVFKLLSYKGIILSQEPKVVRRESFMLRPAKGKQLGSLTRLEWSLADKF